MRSSAHESKSETKFVCVRESETSQGARHQCASTFFDSRLQSVWQHIEYQSWDKAVTAATLGIHCFRVSTRTSAPVKDKIRCRATMPKRTNNEYKSLMGIDDCYIIT